MEFKDNFSAQAVAYAKFRPHYPANLIDFIINLVEDKTLAWDCATGNGQVAVQLAKHFSKIVATDASEAQIKQASPHENIEYRVAKAESSGLSDHSVDLITVAQAIHWFRFDDFYAEVRRVAKPGAWLAIWGYGLFSTSPAFDSVVQELYAEILGEQYWGPERKHIDNRYESIPLPWGPIDTPAFQIQTTWDYKDTLGYLNTWSSVQKYIREKQENPIILVKEKLEEAWGDLHERKTIVCELYLKVAKVL